MDSVVSITPIKIQARDITLDFENSCNCCCFGGTPKPPKPKTPVYINSQGIAEIFDHSKAFDKQEALRRSINHLNIIIVNNAGLVGRDIREVLDEITSSVGVSLDADFPIPLTIDLVQRINTAVNEIFANDKIVNKIFEFPKEKSGV